jgi:lysophospholipase L1-like esterase
MNGVFLYARAISRKRWLNQLIGRALTKGVALFVALVILLLLLEIGIRVYASFLVPRMMILDDKLGWRHASDASKTFVNEFGETALVRQNAHGHRGKYRPVAKQAGSYRLLVLGDSFTEGVHVGEEQLFTARMEEAAPALEVLNAGVGGYGTVQEYLYLANEGLELRPDLVILMFYPNDLTDNALSYYPGFGPRPFASFKNGQLKINETLISTEYEKFILPVPFRTVLSRYSYLYYFLNSRIYQPFFSRKMRDLQQADLNAINSETRFKIFFALLEKLQALLQGGRIPLFVVLIPTREDVAAGRSETSNPIIEFCQARQIACLSLLERFRRETSSGIRPYFPGDIHWTSAGHQIAADEILKHLPAKREMPTHRNSIYSLVAGALESSGI